MSVHPLFLAKCSQNRQTKIDKNYYFALSLLVLCRVLFWIWSPEFAHSTRSNFTDDLEYSNINNVSHFRHIHVCGTQWRSGDLGRTNERTEAMRGYEPGHHGAQCRPEVSVPMTAKDHCPEKRRSRDRYSTRLPLLPGGWRCIEDVLCRPRSRDQRCSAERAWEMEWVHSFWKCTQEELVFYHDPVGYQPGVHWW